MKCSDNCKCGRHSEKAREAHAAVIRGKPGHNLGKKFSAEARANMSKGAKNRPPVSDETKAKMSRALAGKKKTPEWCQRIALAKTGTKLSEEHKASISRSLIGNQHLKGYKHSEKSRANFSAALSKRLRGKKANNAFTKPQMDLACFFVNSGLVVDLEKQFGNRFIDIFLPEYNLGIEADGSRWHNPPFGSPEKDAKRDQEIWNKFRHSNCSLYR